MNDSDAVERISISMPEELLARTKRLARQRGVSLGELLRAATRAYVDGVDASDRPRSVGIGNSGGRGRGRDLAEPPEDAYRTKRRSLYEFS